MRALPANLYFGSIHIKQLTTIYYLTRLLEYIFYWLFCGSILYKTFMNDYAITEVLFCIIFDLLNS